MTQSANSSRFAVSGSRKRNKYPNYLTAGEVAAVLKIAKTTSYAVMDRMAALGAEVTTMGASGSGKIISTSIWRRRDCDCDE